MRFRNFAVAVMLMMCGASGLSAGVKLALVGNFPDGKGVEVDVTNIAVEHTLEDEEHGVPNLELAVYDDAGTLTGAAAVVDEIIADDEVKAVLVHGETSAAPEILEKLHAAGLAVVAASSWIAQRNEETPHAMWLSPTQLELARVAAHYARKARRLKQVAVLDNASATSVAAADMFEKRFKELGGKVVFRGEWQGSHWGMTRTVRALKLNWPQAVFVPLEPEASGRLVEEMKRREMAAAIVIGEPRLFEPEFFNEGRTKTRGSVGIFPCPDYRGRAKLRKHVGLSYAKGGAHWRAYYNYAWKRPHRWTSMVFDGATLAIRAMRNAEAGNDNEGELPESRSAPAPEESVEEARELEAVADAQGQTPLAVVKKSKKKSRRRFHASREAVQTALNEISSYRGIRGVVEFDERRQPRRVRGMVYQALPKVNSKWMQWWDYKFGPPW